MGYNNFSLEQTVLDERVVAGTRYFFSDRAIPKEDTNKKTLFKVWKIIKLGTYQNVEDLCKVLKDKEIKISLFANELLNKTIIPLLEIKLVNVSVADLGLKNGGTYRDVCKKGNEFNLDLCPGAVGGQLCLEEHNQAKEEYSLAMDTSCNSIGNSLIFHISNNGKNLCLSTNCGHPNYYYNACCHFIFCYLYQINYIKLFLR